MSTVPDSSTRALFATTSRLLSCLVTESLSRAIYFPLTEFEGTGFCVLLVGDVSSRPPQSLDYPYEASKILAIALLRHVPVFKHDSADPRGQEIGLLDPMDMLPIILEPVDGREHDDVCMFYAIQCYWC